MSIRIKQRVVIMVGQDWMTELKKRRRRREFNCLCIGLTGYDLDQNNSLSRGGQRADPGTRPLSKHTKWSEGGSTLKNPLI